MADLSDDDIATLWAMACERERPTREMVRAFAHAVIAADRALNAPQAAVVAWQLPGSDSIITAAMKEWRGVLAEQWTTPLYAAPQAAPVAQAERAGWVLARNWHPRVPGQYRCKWHVHPGEIDLVWNGSEWRGPAWDGTMRSPVTFGLGARGVSDEYWSEPITSAAPTPDQTKGG